MTCVEGFLLLMKVRFAVCAENGAVTNNSCCIEDELSVTLDKPQNERRTNGPKDSEQALKLLIVQGYGEAGGVLKAYESGIENVVAFMTESISAQQLEVLASLMDEKQVEDVELF